MMSEPNNATRAAWAENAVNTFGVETYGGRTFTATVKEQPENVGDAYTMVTDLIANLLHLARKHGWGAGAIMTNARGMFDYEVDEEEDEEVPQCWPAR